jgi:hypothetical protein
MALPNDRLETCPTGKKTPEFSVFIGTRNRGCVSNVVRVEGRKGTNQNDEPPYETRSPAEHRPGTLGRSHAGRVAALFGVQPSDGHSVARVGCALGAAFASRTPKSFRQPPQPAPLTVRIYRSEHGGAWSLVAKNHPPPISAVVVGWALSNNNALLYNLAGKAHPTVLTEIGRLQDEDRSPDTPLLVRYSTEGSRLFDLRQRRPIVKVWLGGDFRAE